VIMSPPVQILGGTCPPCPIGIDAPDYNSMITTSEARLAGLICSVSDRPQHSAALRHLTSIYAAEIILLTYLLADCRRPYPGLLRTSRTQLLEIYNYSRSVKCKMHFSILKFFPNMYYIYIIVQKVTPLK